MRTFVSPLVRSVMAAIIVFTICPAVAVKQVNAQGVATRAKYIVLIVLDSCRQDYLSLVPTPNIDKLKAGGTFYTNSWVGQLSNDTPPGHTSIATGRFSKNTSIISFNWRDPRLQPPGWDLRVRLTEAAMSLVKATGWTDFGLWYLHEVVRKSIEQNFITGYDNVVAGKLNRFIADSGSTGIGALYKKAHPGARVAAVSCDKWYAAAGLAADDADIVVFCEARGAAPVGYNMVSRLKPDGIKGKMPPAYILDDKSLVRDWKDERDSDTWATDVALKLIEKEAPEVMLINLPAIDDAGHEYGSVDAAQKMGAVVANADLQVGRIMDAYEKAGRYAETLWVIASDHGMTPYTVSSSQDVLDRVLLKSGNFTNTSNHVYLLYPQTAAETAETIVNAGLTGITGAYYKTKDNTSGYVYEPTATTAKRITGDLDRCYRYLLGTYAGATSPDIELIMTENTHFDWTMFGLKPYHAQHDAVTWLSQNTVRLFSGPGVKKGSVSESPARLVDVAPTALTLLGIMPERMDGIVLSDALFSPTSRQAHTQIALNSELIPMVEAIKALSKTELAALKAK